MSGLATKTTPTFTIALAGNPNSGKTTLFNALTGLRQKTGNYPGVTVEHKSGTWDINGSRFRLIDLPGCYSLIPRSPDEQVASDVVHGRNGAPCPDATVCVVDVTNLARHLYLAGQIIETGRPVIVALTMVDEAKRLGLTVDTEKLAGSGRSHLCRQRGGYRQAGRGFAQGHGNFLESARTHLSSPARDRIAHQTIGVAGEDHGCGGAVLPRRAVSAGQRW
jgi:small GTP-binding protein